MDALQTLAAQAVIGTERQAPSLPVLPGAIGATLEALNQNPAEPAANVLRTAGVLAFCGRAGFRLDDSALPPVAPCPPETLPPSDALTALLGQIIDDGPERLQAEAFRRLLGAYLPHRLLPKVLELGSRSRAIRTYLLPVLGQRGVWLARQNPAWAFAAGGGQNAADPSQWETGSLDQRLIYLRDSRQTDPLHGRELFAAALPELGAKERAALLAVFGESLVAEDAEVLEGLLKDRSKDVRQIAVSLLTRLPDSGFAARMAACLDACLSEQRKLLRTVLAINPPETFDPAWKSDAVEEAKPQNETLGPRAWWLYQLARSVPLAWWESRTGLTPDELLDWAKKGEWTLALWRAWLETQTACADPVWADAFLRRLPRKDFPADRFKLIQCLPQPERERYWLQDLQKAPAYALGAYLQQILKSLPFSAEPFSNGFSRQVLALVQSQNNLRDHTLREAMAEFACLIPFESFADMSLPWPEAAADSAVESRFAAILGQRQTLHSHTF